MEGGKTKSPPRSSHASADQPQRVRHPDPSTVTTPPAKPLPTNRPNRPPFSFCYEGLLLLNLVIWRCRRDEMALSTISNPLSPSQRPHDTTLRAYFSSLLLHLFLAMSSLNDNTNEAVKTIMVRSFPSFNAVATSLTYCPNDSPEYSTITTSSTKRISRPSSPLKAPPTG